MAEEAHRRQHPVDRRIQPPGQRLALAQIGLPQRDQIGEDRHRRSRIARDVAAIGKHLAVEFFGQMPRRDLDAAAGGRQAERDEGERRANLQPRRALGRFLGDGAQVPGLRRQAAQKALVEAGIGLGQQHVGMAQPGDHPARSHRGLEGGIGQRAALLADPVVDEGAGVLHGQGIAGLGVVTQPVETVEFGRIGFRRQRRLKDRGAAGFEQLSGEEETAGIDRLGDHRVAMAQRGRHDQKLAGAASGKTPAVQRTGPQPPPRPAPHFT